GHPRAAAGRAPALAPGGGRRRGGGGGHRAGTGRGPREPDRAVLGAGRARRGGAVLAAGRAAAGRAGSGTGVRVGVCPGGTATARRVRGGRRVAAPPAADRYADRGPALHRGGADRGRVPLL